MSHHKIPKKPPPKDRPETLDEVAERLFEEPPRPLGCIRNGQLVQPGKKAKIYK